MKQAHGTYTFTASTKTITLLNLSIPLNQLLLITNVTRGVVYYNFTSPSHRASVTQGESVTTILLTDASTSGHADSDKLLIHYEDLRNSDLNIGGQDAPFADSDTGATTLLGSSKRLNVHLSALREEIGAGTRAVGGASAIGLRNDAVPVNATDSGSLIAFIKRLNSAIDSIFGSTFLSLNNSQATFRISHPYGTLGIASPSYIVTANTAQLVFSAKSTSSPRRFLLLQNTSDTPMYVGFGTGLYAKPAASGSVNGITITSGGSGYGAAPSVTFSPPPAGGTTATGTAVISGGVVTSVVITDSGSGYASAPSIVIAPSGGTAATANAIIGPTGLYLAPSFGTLSFDGGFIPNDVIYLTCASQGKSFVAVQA